jgi:hypothetical protein
MSQIGRTAWGKSRFALHVDEKVVVGLLDLVAKLQVLDAEHRVRRETHRIGIKNLRVHAHLVEQGQPGADVPARRVNPVEWLERLGAEHLLVVTVDRVAADAGEDVFAEIPSGHPVRGALLRNT